ncbi:hypothetical protein [Herbiconiux flava]|uniref:Uncharacterized protein n=1 Tax=Herbiconiux flava TaxID=881268 RepID=A0A852SL39_9MICO|nr:hypothetical protein [Herbiconiux flava]NYD69361.1 hypothetical protein [Herbiconiux flava]GLK16108.1 hypothetical protein GCM10017602_05900 [Herbiconiux flava]
MQYLFAMRFVAGLGIGGDHVAIDELFASHYRGRLGITINASLRDRVL